MPEEVLAYFDRDGAAFVPRPYARNPWTPTGLHGRLCAGLIAHAIEIEHGSPDFHVARFTTDLFRMAPLAPVEVRTQLIRDGNRIRVADGVVLADGKEVARASAVMLRKGPNPEGEVWSLPNWDVPRPEDVPSPRDPALQGRVGGDPIRDTRPISPNPKALVQKRQWIRDHGQLIAGEDISPFVRIAMAADITNPFGNTGLDRLAFVNADVTSYLHRYPDGEWLGFEVANHGSANGVAVASCNLYDVHGPMGTSIVCAVADNRVREGTNAPGQAGAIRTP